MESSGFTDRQKRIIGALLGVHAGDSLGATLEFVRWEETKALFPTGLTSIIGGGHFEWEPGHATDDTDLTRAVLLAYSKRSTERKSYVDVLEAAADNMLDWATGRWPGRQPGSSPKDIGGATFVGLTRYRQSIASGRKDPRGCGSGQGSAGNGSLMRCIPTALFAANEEERLQHSIDISAVTHDDIRCTIACAAYNTIVAQLIDGQSPATAVGEGKACATVLAVKTTSNKTHLRPNADAVVRAIELGEKLKPTELVEDGPGILPGRGRGFVLESLTLAIAAVLDDRPFKEVICDIVMLGADSDTNAAIAGGLLGARDGIDAIPKDWRDVLQFGEEFTSIALALS
ncbi:ADP-ribosylglycohydrolase [Pseudovirgaria hyperparasitica]|uniref:ADP-ribosylhydrolase ARH3 n=1 Tax=Pseudovirgaria hyperparasitica TaxID=470096 RepID=A0A6A6VWH1_9PEZI|nr:ADP-ribosylglycohydrolase [Pseudovirgaria hyperparasitica]KAF2754515.1 ADP-ribosylglycohydrolase [Pseudovirgaria hyperparasitica]